MTATPQPKQDQRNAANGAVVVRLQPAPCPTDEQFYAFCRLNDELRIERDAQGEVSILPPAVWETAVTNLHIAAQLHDWARTNGTGLAADSSAGYVLPNGAIRSPDASWVRNERLSGLTADERSRFLPVCPDFVIELLSPTDSLPALHAKMAEYVANGTVLGWLIDPASRTVFVYRPGTDPEEMHSLTSVSGDPALEGFRLKLKEIWQTR